MALIAALIAVSLTAEPSRLVLGKDEGADLTLRAPARAKVTFSTSVGTVSAARRDGEVFRARYTPPRVKVPSVALLLAQVEEDGARDLFWLALPLSGADTMEIETRPGASVQADVAGRRVGPVVADKNGIARLPMVVPPGVAKATLHISDKLGNANEKPLDLEPPPFPRLRVAARDGEASAAAPLEVEIFVVRADGTPDDRAKVDLIAPSGAAEVRGSIAPGVYLASFTPPAALNRPVRLEATAAGQRAALDVTVTQSKVRSAQPFWRNRLSAQRPWAVSLGFVGGVGSTFDGAGEGTALFEAALGLEALPLEALVEVGASFFSELTQNGSSFSAGERARPQSRYGQIGLRFAKELVPGLDGHVSALFGLQSQVVGRTFPTNRSVAQDEWTPRFGLALGVNLRAGPGRVLGQVQLDSSASGVAGLAGNLGGMQAMVGYLVGVR